MSHSGSSFEYNDHNEDYDYEDASYDSYDDEFTLYGNQDIEREYDYNENDDYDPSFKDC